MLVKETSQMITRYPTRSLEHEGAQPRDDAAVLFAVPNGDLTPRRVAGVKFYEDVSLGISTLTRVLTE
jgi:hypothetical protein